MNTIEQSVLMLDGTSYADGEGFDCGNNFNNLAELIRWLVLHHGHGPGPGDPVYTNAAITRELTQVAAGLASFVSSRGIQDASLRARVATEGLQRSAKALAGLERQTQTAN